MAYTYKIQDDFRAGIPQTAFLRGAGPFRGISCHWTAGAPGYSGARGTINFLIQRADRNASYHEIWWWEDKTFGVIRIVRPDRASHSMNPSPPTWSPNSIVRRILDDRVGDPNRYAYSVSFAGMPADLAKAIADPDFVRAAARRTKELYSQFRSLAADPLFNHGEGQPSTRTDWGLVLRPKIYAELRAPAGENDVVNDYIKTGDRSIIGRIVHLKPGSTARTSPTFDRNNYDANKIATRDAASTATAIAWVTGSNLTLSDGSIYDASTKWIATDSHSNGIVFWHSRDVDRVETPVVEDQSQVIADLKTQLGQRDTRIVKMHALADEIKAA